MNILLLNWRDPKNSRSGGAEYVTLEHAKAWVKNGNRVTWIAASFKGAKKQETLSGITIIRRGNTATIFFFALLYYLQHRKSIDVIVDEVHGIPFFSVLYARKPVVLFIHEVAGDIWNTMYTFPISWIGRLLESWYIWLYSGHTIWTDAESTVNELVSFGVFRNHCVAIPCPIANRPTALPPKKNRDLTCIFVGRLVRMKRIEDVLVGFCDISYSYPNAKLMIVGQGDASYVCSLKKLACSLHISDRVIWCGKVTEDEKRKLLSESHLLLHSSVKEGWGLVVLEAASQWTPSVVYGVSGLIDTVKDGDTGIIVESQNPHDLARSALDLYHDNDRYKKMQKRAVRWSGQLRWAEVTKQSQDLLRQAYETRR